MSTTPTSGLNFKLSIGAPLLVVAIGAWYFSVVLYQTSSPAGMSSMAPAVPIASMGSMFSTPNIGVVLAFLVVWMIGMVAMMFPAMVPVMSFYSGLVTKQERRPNLSRVLGIPLFLGGYLSLYLLLGAGLFAAVYLVFQLGLVIPSLSSWSVVGVAVVLFATGIWQLTPLKEKMLGKCVSPLGFFMTHAKKGFGGAFRMGAEHGVYCVGCCWLYMLVMLAVAAMSLVSMVLLSGLIIVEKAFVGRTSWFKWMSAGIFLFLGAAVLLFPSFAVSI
jgi:predicted metal-binding membrane protein